MSSTDNRPRDAVQTFVVPAHQDFKQRRLTGENVFHDLLIGQRGPLFQYLRTDYMHHCPHSLE